MLLNLKFILPTNQKAISLSSSMKIIMDMLVMLKVIPLHLLTSGNRCNSACGVDGTSRLQKILTELTPSSGKKKPAMTDSITSG